MIFFQRAIDLDSVLLVCHDMIQLELTVVVGVRRAVEHGHGRSEIRMDIDIVGRHAKLSSDSALSQWLAKGRHQATCDSACGRSFNSTESSCVTTAIAPYLPSGDKARIVVYGADASRHLQPAIAHRPIAPQSRAR